MNNLIDAESCVKKLNKDGIVKWSNKNFSKLKRQGLFIIHKNTTPGKKRSVFNYEEVVYAVKKNKNDVYEPQSKANDKKRNENQKKEDEGMFHKSVQPEHSVATMSEEDKKKYDANILATIEKLKDMSSEEENDDRPGTGATGQDWNTFKTKQQALNYELDRKLKEGDLMYLDDFKATSEILLGPLNQGLDDLAFSFKSQFPDITDEVIQWLLKRTNQLKVDVQNVSL